MKGILIIGSNAGLCASMVASLEAAGFESVAVHDGREGLKRAASGDYALTVVDLATASAEGAQYLRQIRAVSEAPLLTIASSDRDEERIEALDAGADDCLPKRFNPRELRARIEAILRRVARDAEERSPTPASPGVITVGDIEVDAGLRTAYREGRPMRLTSVEFNLLSILLLEAGNVISREELASRALGRALGMNDRSIDVHISSLRRKLGKDLAGVDRIRTVRSWGYLYAKLRQPLKEAGRREG